MVPHFLQTHLAVETQWNQMSILTIQDGQQHLIQELKLLMFNEEQEVLQEYLTEYSIQHILTHYPNDESNYGLDYDGFSCPSLRYLPHSEYWVCKFNCLV